MLALTILLALTGLALLLAEVGGVERRLGSADESRLQALNAADSGLAIATVLLLDGRPPEALDVVFGVDSRAGAVRVSRARVAAPSLVETAPCEACGGEGTGWTRLGFALEAIGEHVVLAALVETGVERTLARAAVEATLTLQPWPAGGGTGAIASGAPADALAPECDAEAARRVYERLARELHPAGCRLVQLGFRIRARDPVGGSICAVDLPVCVLLSDWRERLEAE